MPFKRDKYEFRRNLPHYQAFDRDHFVTFKTWKNWILPPASRDIVFQSCFYWHEKKLSLRALVVMPDHVHLMLEPLRNNEGLPYTLSEILHSIKSFTAHQINKDLSRQGTVWQDESFDHVERTYNYTMAGIEYIRMNPVEARLVGKPGEYKWLWIEGMALPEFEM